MGRPGRKSGKLTALQKRFVEEYMVDARAVPAAERAGYKPSTATKQAFSLLKMPHVRAAIEAQQAKLSEKVEYSAQNVLEGLVREAEREGEGSSHSARVAALGLLAKHFGILIDKTEHREEREITVRFVRE